ncbi:MAG: glycosyltransferase family 4 protein [Cyanobacteria bacterium J06621_8]
MKQQKILFIDHTAVMGGAELCLLDLASAYAASCKVLLFEDGVLRERLEQLKVEVEVIPAAKSMLNLRASGGLNSLTSIPELWRLAGAIAKAAVGYDLILANSQKAFVVSALASLNSKVPLCWYLHDILTAGHFSQINRRVAVFLANKFATRVMVNSRATGAAFVAAGGKKDLIQLVYNGFDARRFDTVTTEEIKTIRSEIGVTEATLIGLFSRFSYWKGQHILLKAVRELSEVQVILVGKALFGEEDYVSELESLVQQPDFKGRIHLLGFRNDVPALMKACDIVVHTSTEPEPFGRVIVEGQLAHKPVIASAAGGALELIEDGKTGFLFPPGDAIALRESIQKLISDRCLAESLGKQGYASAKEKFSLKRTLSSFEEVLLKA